MQYTLDHTLGIDTDSKGCHFKTVHIAHEMLLQNSEYVRLLKMHKWWISECRTGMTIRILVDGAASLATPAPGIRPGKRRLCSVPGWMREDVQSQNKWIDRERVKSLRYLPKATGCLQLDIAMGQS